MEKSILIVGFIALMVCGSMVVFFLDYTPTPGVEDEPPRLVSIDSNFNDTYNSSSEWQNETPDRWVWNETTEEYEGTGIYEGEVL